MNLAAWVGLWGGVVSTSLAVLQFAKWRRERPRLVVKASLEYVSASAGEDPNAGFGTPLVVKRDRDVLDQRVSVKLNVANHGEQALQVVAIIIEASGSGPIVNVNQIVAEGLPAVIEPRSSVTVDLQKEFLDMASEIMFVGFVDALGRRHPVPDTNAKSAIESSWRLPTRVQWYQRRDDPEADPVQAFQAKQQSSITNRPRKQNERPLASRAVSRPERKT
ncbi:hypothetical protein CCUG60885_01377 [Mycobacteroides salmoniphilum]|uniref:Uncharacterized protein n=1 Tax=Mycobacteroides salmoniphilum TaxID=404941 RepID=A0A4R8SEJ4_9MYCO|nr:hypothetical protein [Mycobacteroides salmoniphilum]TDZ95246.1 hypothetical protein CCUG60885_01377 [Mycobacteroides salmoniphilum]TEA04342.1 hypothetical protein CCUG60883_01635 [Mycobacteroides salmoniphilum]